MKREKKRRVFFFSPSFLSLFSLSLSLFSLNFLLLTHPVTACIASKTIEKSGRAIRALMAPKSKTSCSVSR